MDIRDGQTWVVLELTRSGEMRAEEGTLIPSLRETLKLKSNHPIFIPSTSFKQGNRTITIHLMEGYVFVASGPPETSFFNLEITSPLIKGVLSSESPCGLRTLNTLPNSSIEEMREKLQAQVANDILPGMTVRITDGTYANIEAEVLNLEEGMADLFIKFRSLEVITAIPKIFLEPVDKNF